MSFEPFEYGWQKQDRGQRPVLLFLAGARRSGPQAGKAALRRMCWGCAKALGEALKTTGSRLRRWPTWMLAQRRRGGANNEPRCFA